ncbi:unnamed protein product [Polarella glacialis]|uniref:Reverse transcriptase domain-containing protein n=1 Tax=Polarella glacialis TaxID=89957 RepID=A0A813DDN5_POLGL|nr:unnamed protein product [Polarella glacialis]
MNVHQAPGLHYSSGSSPEGRALFGFCSRFGFVECVRKPTRGDYLLDLVLSDIDCRITTEVLPQICDHKLVLSSIGMSVPSSISVTRECWIFAKADWTSLQAVFSDTNWVNILGTSDASQMADRLVNYVLGVARLHIPVKQLLIQKSTHPWLSSKCLASVAAKCLLEGTPEYEAAQADCSRILFEEYTAYVSRTKELIKALPTSSKRWWTLSNLLMFKHSQTSSIPPLRADHGQWVQDPAGKADLLADTFAAKCCLPEAVNNIFSEGAGQIDASINNSNNNRNNNNQQQQQSTTTINNSSMSGFLPVRRRKARQLLKALDEDKATGPDLLSARLLKNCADALSFPVVLLARCILNEGGWLEAWRLHWVFPLHKKRSRADAGNYRGIHLTPHISKVMERLIGSLFLPFLYDTGAFGPNQFAYSPHRGYRDALAVNVCTWLQAISMGKRVGLYCSDVSGAFDRVNACRLLLKLKLKSIHPHILRVIGSWLRDRRAHVVVDGVLSAQFILRDMVFQGTVWGPPLWNSFFEDARKAVNSAAFTETIFADDLNCFRIFAAGIGNVFVNKQLHDCQAALHERGAGNQVSFDSDKESMHILSKTSPEGDSFEILGVLFDTKLLMNKAIHNLAAQTGWRVRSILRTRRYYDVKALVRLHKCHVLSYIEGVTSAIYHEAPSTLALLDDIQSDFLNEVGLSAEVGLLEFNLAPLSSRRDFAMLGLLHKIQLGLAPSALTKLFPRQTQPIYAYAQGPVQSRHDRRFLCPVHTRSPPYLQRSVFGLTRVYNELPQHIVDSSSVKFFQRELQNKMKRHITELPDRWAHMFRSY